MYWRSLIHAHFSAGSTGMRWQVTASVLLVDSDTDNLTELTEALRPYLLDIHGVTTKEDALMVLKHRLLELVVLDAGVLHLDEFMACEMRRRSCALIITTRDRCYELAVQAIRLNAVDIVEKPIAMTRVVNLIAKVLDQRIASPHFLARRIDRFLRQNCGRADLRLADVSHAFGISLSYASLLLRSGHWRGFRDRLARHRVERARELLVGSHRPLYVIAEQCGFTTPSRFSETFSRVVGIGPKRYRENDASVCAGG